MPPESSESLARKMPFSGWTTGIRNLRESAMGAKSILNISLAQRNDKSRIESLIIENLEKKHANQVILSSLRIQVLVGITRWCLPCKRLQYIAPQLL